MTARVVAERARNVQIFADKMGTRVTAAMAKMIQLQDRRTAAAAMEDLARDLARLTSVAQKSPLQSQSEHQSQTFLMDAPVDLPATVQVARLA